MATVKNLNLIRGRFYSIFMFGTGNFGYRINIQQSKNNTITLNVNSFQAY